MLLTFKGPGCTNCPFFHEKFDPLLGEVELVCTLSNQPFTFDNQEIELIPDEDKIPKDCPFGEYPNTLEIECWPGG